MFRFKSVNVICGARVTGDNRPADGKASTGGLKSAPGILKSGRADFLYLHFPCK